MKSFEVSVYHVDEQDEAQSDILDIQLAHLFSGTIEATDVWDAAIKAWIDGVGVHVQARLSELGDPDIVCNWQTDPEAIAQHLSPTNIGLGDNWLVLEVPGDAWLISVNDIEPEFDA